MLKSTKKTAKTKQRSGEYHLRAAETLASIDGDTAMRKMLHFGAKGAKEFAKAFLLKSEHTSAHENGDLHIHDLDFLPAGKLTCCQTDPLELFANGGFSTGHGFLRTPNSISSYCALAAIILQANQNEMHGGQSIPNFDYAMAEGVRKTYKKNLAHNLAKFSRFKNNKALTKKETELAEAEAREDTRIQTYQAMEGLVHNLNAMHSHIGAQVPSTSLNFGTDTTPEGQLVTEQFLLAIDAGLGKGEAPAFPTSIFKVKEGVNYNPEDPNYHLFKLAMLISSKRHSPNFVFIDAPFNLQYYKKGDYKTEVATMDCRTRVFSSIFPESDGRITGRGNCSFTTINLPRIAIKHGIAKGERSKADFDGFYKELKKKLALAAEQLLERFNFQAEKTVKNFPFLMGQGVWINSSNLKPDSKLREVIKHGTLSIGFIGLAEALIALTGKHHGESEEAQKLGLEIVKFMRNLTDKFAKKYHLNYSLLATPAEGLAESFTKTDAKNFGRIKGVTDKEFYTNSFHVPASYRIGMHNKIDIEAPYHALCNAGHITYVEMDGDICKNLEAFESIIRYMKDAGIGYGSVNPPVDRDPVCGFSGVIDRHVCPACGRKEGNGELKFERLR